jgi:hypothetical protein
MPILVLACNICPQQIEATFYSLVLALINVGYLLSYNIGGILTYQFGITNTDFSNLGSLILVASLYPLLVLPLMICFMPSETKLKELKQ